MCEYFAFKNINIFSITSFYCSVWYQKREFSIYLLLNNLQQGKDYPLNLVSLILVLSEERKSIQNHLPGPEHFNLKFIELMKFFLGFTKKSM